MHRDAFGEEGEQVAALVDRIRTSPHYIPELSLVSDVAGGVAGHVMISGATLRGQGGDSAILILSPLGVRSIHQQQGIGGALVRAVCAAAHERDEPMIVLEGSPAYYRRFGFEPAHERGIELPLPDWAPRQAGQLHRLEAYSEAMRGTVIYPSAFDEVSGQQG